MSLVDDVRDEWYELCVENATSFPLGSPQHIFWWSLRMELDNEETIRQWAEHPDKAFRSWVDYFLYKWNDIVESRP